MLFLAAALLAATPAPSAPEAPCALELKGRQAQKVSDSPFAAVGTLPHWGALFAQMYVTAVEPAKSRGRDVSQSFYLFNDSQAPKVAVPIAVPEPLKGTVEVTPPPPHAEGWCTRATLRMRDGQLSSLDVDNGPFDVRASVTRQGRALWSKQLKAQAVSFTPTTLDASGEKGESVRLPVGATPAEPSEAELAALEELFQRLKVDPVQELERAPKAAPAVYVELALERLSDEALSAPEQRFKLLKLLGTLDASGYPAPLARELAYWRSTMASIGAPAGRATLEISSEEKDIAQLWVFGRKLFDAKQAGAKRQLTVELPASGAVRVWVVQQVKAKEGALTSTADFWAVLRDGQTYLVEPEGLALKSTAGDDQVLMRDCAVLVADDKLGAALAGWREANQRKSIPLGQPAAPRATGSTRAWVAVSKERRRASAAPFPPESLVYAYTHPGTYRFALEPDGSLRLSLDPGALPCRAHPGSP